MYVDDAAARKFVPIKMDEAKREAQYEETVLAAESRLTQRFTDFWEQGMWGRVPKAHDVSRFPPRERLYYHATPRYGSHLVGPARLYVSSEEDKSGDRPPSPLSRPSIHRRVSQLRGDLPGTPWRLSRRNSCPAPPSAASPPPRRRFNAERALGLIRRDHPSRKWPSYEDPYPEHHLHGRSHALTGDTPLPFEDRPEFAMPPREPRLNDPEEDRPQPNLPPKWRKLLRMTKGEGRTEEVMRMEALKEAMSTEMGSLEETAAVPARPAARQNEEGEDEDGVDDRISELDPAELLGVSWEDADFVNPRELALDGNVMM